MPEFYHKSHFCACHIIAPPAGWCSLSTLDLVEDFPVECGDTRHTQIGVRLVNSVFNTPMVERSIHQQIFDSLNKATRILIPLGASPSGDSIAAALALADFLRKLNKEPLIVCSGEISEKYRFLPGVGNIQRTIHLSRGFVISVRTNTAPLDELTYHLDEQSNQVNIFLMPKSGQYVADDVSFRADTFPYDLIVVLDLPSLDQLRSLYDDNTDLFFETPIINIDHHPNNEHFGELNLVDITATSTAEILMELLEGFEIGLLDGNIATNLLAGILIETNSFQNRRTTPKAFLKASSLISLGANQQEIIKNLYKTKSVNLLKLWGRALARLKEVPDLGLAYSLLKTDDLTKSGSQNINEVMEELIASLTDARLILLLAEIEPGETLGYLYIHPNLPALEISNLLSGQLLESNLTTFRLSGKTILEAEAQVLGDLHRMKEKILPQ
ncbi:MAG: hypothetical protein A2722_00310 [Candidatus Doudnabacteria bacterium RIFCSPHIGHO2_01_FULL_50_11]|uniref:DDH domain-containing protein n=1 Tax=Candidatus Doudnabacteria bacterium RIFCSPHIGHO2_01_FULL_50_11 TaxID=1817828 RepID=A0A1F5PHM8_9BACT|nr:MAG: hypothetical protein A2722_00310 [Candidatus Doudnabacteria bacterium RIFCSPHIGHO2_01_FULL_50_11]HLC44921.1 DHH family phosphoesterase [Patescibacteria group bacterium]